MKFIKYGTVTNSRLNICFCCSDGFHSMKECKSNRTCRVSGCSKKNNRLLHSDAQKPSTVQTKKPKVEASTNSVASNNSGLLQIVQIKLANCDTKQSQLHF